MHIVSDMHMPFWQHLLHAPALPAPPLTTLGTASNSALTIAPSLDGVAAGAASGPEKCPCPAASNVRMGTVKGRPDPLWPDFRLALPVPEHLSRENPAECPGRTSPGFFLQAARRETFRASRDYQPPRPLHLGVFRFWRFLPEELNDGAGASKGRKCWRAGTCPVNASYHARLSINGEKWAV